MILPFGFWKLQKRKHTHKKKFESSFCYICLENLQRQQKHALTFSTKEKSCIIRVQERNTVTRHIYQTRQVFGYLGVLTCWTKKKMCVQPTMVMKMNVWMLIWLLWVFLFPLFNSRKTSFSQTHPACWPSPPVLPRRTPAVSWHSSPCLMTASITLGGCKGSLTFSSFSQPFR